MAYAIRSPQFSDSEKSPRFSETELPSQTEDVQPFFVDKNPQLPSIESYVAATSQQYHSAQPTMNPVPIFMPQAVQAVQTNYALYTNYVLGLSLQMQKRGSNTGTDQNERRNYGRMRMTPLKEYAVPPEIATIEQNADDPQAASDWLSMLLKLQRNRTDADKYFEAYTKMIYLEEAKQSQFLTQFNAENIHFEYSGDEFRFKNNENTSKINDAVGENLLDHFTLTVVKSATDFDTETEVRVTGQIKSCNKEYIFARFSGESLNFMSNFYYKRKFNIVFHVNRTPFQLQHSVLERMRELNLFGCLINNSLYDTVSDQSIDHDNYFFKGKLAMKLNEEQKTAVKNIVNASSFPLPYLLFGPAGTGKTRTLVAAIEEIVRTSDKCVLICANSNAACDEITERLMQVLRTDEMFRLYTSSYNPKKMNERFKKVSNWCDDSFPMPALTFLYSFRVLICTLCTAGNLSRDDRKRNPDPKHFSHVIIDECASTHETMTMIPIAGLCSSKEEITSSLVLAGDPKQLDAVTRSRYAAQLGYNVSFMEQLSKRPLYKTNPKTGEYNQNYITLLVKNYRSHSAILHAANTLFYENKLQVRAAKEITDWYIGSDLLPSKIFPMIFHSVQGYVSKSSKDFSLLNMKEVNIVMQYIRKLLESRTGSGNAVRESDIGIVTPYKLQCKVIGRNCLRNGFKDITVGTAEVFQGQERPIMIVSTVCGNGILGFVRDPRRMNVIITRAKSLLIIVGDPHTLSKDKNWSTLIQYCVQNKALIQGAKPFHFKIQAP